MSNGDFEINGHLIGPGHPTFVTAFDPGDDTARDQDQLNPAADRRHFGRDYRTPGVWALKFSVGGDNDVEVLAELSALRRAWRSNHRSPGETTRLTYTLGGRTRFVTGRPRDFNYDPNQNLDDGNVVAAGKFVLADTLVRDAAQASYTLTIRPPASGAVTLPAVWPLLSSPAGERQGAAAVAGDAATPARIVFNGPISNPALVSDDWAVELQAEVPAFTSVTVDAETGTVTRSDGTPLQGAISRRTYLPDVVLEPGPASFLFTGTDPTGTATATIQWHPAYEGL